MKKAFIRQIAKEKRQSLDVDGVTMIMIMIMIRANQYVMIEIGIREIGSDPGKRNDEQR